MKWHIDDFIRVVQGREISRKENYFNQAGIDTRHAESIKAGAFFALKDKRDGHDYLSSAVRGQANMLVVESLDKAEELKKYVTVVQVSNTVSALQKWAQYWREKLNFKVAAVTGSNGKTSAKHFCKTIFREDPSVLASPHSYNNHLGVPLSLLKADEKTRFVIQEIGSSKKGEIQHLCSIAQPDISVCTMVGLSHTKGLNCLEDIAQEKEHIYAKTGRKILGVFNLDNPWTLAMKKKFQEESLGEFLSFSSENPKADIYLQASEMGEDFLILKGRIQGVSGKTRTPLAGRHYLTSIMSAAGAGAAMGKKPQDIWSSFSFFKNPEGRFQVVQAGKQKILFDAYNSNPQSMEAFLDYISFIGSQNFCVLCIGDMLDLGGSSAELHRQLGVKTAEAGAGYIFYIGKYRYDFEKGLKESKKQVNYELYADNQEGLSEKIFSVLKPSSLLAFKASRGLQLEKILDNIKKYCLADE